MSDSIALLAVLSLCAWAYLRYGRGDFWRADQRLSLGTPELDHWPAVTAVIPARDEAQTIGRAVRSLLAQDYPGALNLVVVDDESSDGTAYLAAQAGDPDRLSVIRGERLPAGWTGKLWAVDQGVRSALERWPESVFLLLTDADIEHAASGVRRLVAKAERERRDLVSLMALLRCRVFWERLLVPAFVFFFQKLYPFPWVNDPRRRHAAAAGGCMLLRAEALQRAGGIAAVRRRLIDDCAGAALIKSHGSVWVGLSEDTRSLRPYARLADFWTMVARTAFTQLDHSFVWLLATVAAMTVSYGMPPLAVLYGLFASDLWAAVLGALAWAMMLATFRPTLSLYGVPAPVGVALPLAGVLFALMTIDSARRTWQHGGATWKGRTFDPMRAGAGPEAG